MSKLEDLALAVRRSGEDTTWRGLVQIPSEISRPAAIVNRVEDGKPVDGAGAIPASTSAFHEKLAISFESGDTLTYIELPISAPCDAKELLARIRSRKGCERRTRAQGGFNRDAKAPAATFIPQGRQGPCDVGEEGGESRSRIRQCKVLRSVRALTGTKKGVWWVTLGNPVPAAGTGAQ